MTGDQVPIEYSEATASLTGIRPVGRHRPVWDSPECPSCGTVPCGHVDVLICSDCDDLWPCAVVALVLAELRFWADVAMSLTDSLDEVTEVVPSRMALTSFHGLLMERMGNLGGKR